MLAKPKKKKRSDKKIIGDKLLKTAKLYVYLRDDYTCQHCGKRDGTDYQASHVIPVSAGQKLKYDAMNMKVLCYHCHLNWWHKNPLEAAAWFAEKFPERKAYLDTNRGIAKFLSSDLEEMLALYEAKIEELKLTNEA